MVNTEKLNTAIRTAGLRKDSLAASLGISRQSFTNKLKNRTEFKASESLSLMNTLHLSKEEFVDIFFANGYDSQSYRESC